MAPRMNVLYSVVALFEWKFSVVGLTSAFGWGRGRVSKELEGKAQATYQGASFECCDEDLGRLESWQNAP